MPKLMKRFDIQIHGAAMRAATRNGEQALLLTAGHQVLQQNLTDGSIKVLGDGYDMPAGVVASADGRSLFIADLDPARRQFVLYQAAADKAGRMYAKALLSGAGQPTQLAVSGTALYYADRLGGKLMAVDLASHRQTTLLSGLNLPAGVMLSKDGKRVYVSESGAGRIVSVAPGNAGRTVERVGLLSPQYLSAAVKGDAVLIPQYSAAGFIQSWSPATNQTRTLLNMSAADHPVAAWEVGNTLYIVDQHYLWWWDLIGQVSLPVSLTVPDTKPFIGSYLRVNVSLGTTGLAFDDLDFVLPDGQAAGMISYARDDDSAPDEVMLLVGYQPGPHTLQAVDRNTSAVVATLDYEITDRWTDPNQSPKHWNVGELTNFVTGYTWGGGSSTPQNVDVIPQSGTRNICIVTVDVDGSRYPTGATFDTLKTHWSDGVVGPAPSTRTYYEEVSHGSFTMALASGNVLSISLSSNWTDNFSMMSPPFPGNSFQPIDSIAFAQACISAAAALTDGSGNPLVDFQQVKSLIMVIRSQGATSGDNFFWPQAWGGSFTVPGGSATMNVLGMPDDWDTVRGTRTIPETLSHEMGHNLGYPDLYTNNNVLYSADVIARDITNYDLMSQDAEIPDMTIVQKMETGWVRPEWVMPFDFSRSTIPLDQSVTLHPSELGAPPAGRFSAVEIRIADGWNYYFEYRRMQAGQVGDQSLALNPGDTASGAVLGTDVITQSFTFPIARPQVMRLRPDAEGENSFFTAGQDYKETDTSSMAIADFRMSVTSVGTDNAQIRIQYGTNGRPDLYIRPWPGGDNWQSPDIEVRNARSMADPANWANVPWVGHANTVIARYRNRGPVTCRNVRVDFFVKDYTVSGGPEVSIGSDTQDVPPESGTPFVEFSTNWIPADDGHKCIIVRTPLYIDASVNPNIVELSDSNNSAQSNYTRYIAASASPAKRGIAQVTLHNPFDKRAEIYVIPQIRGQFAYLYRLYLEHSAVKLDPGESRKVEVMIESMYGDPRLGALWERIQQKLFDDTTRITLTGYGLPADSPEHPVLLGGAQINVSSARATRFEQFGWQPDGGVVRGRVVVVSNGAPAVGMVLLTFHGPNETVDNTVRVALDSQGYFTIRGVGPLVQKFRAKRIGGHYPGRPGYAPCDPAGDLVV